MSRETPANTAALRGWRLRLGVGLFALGLVCPVFVPLVAASGLPTQWKTVLSGALMLGFPEVLWLAAVAVLGKAGFETLQARAWGFVKRHALPAGSVGPTRYRVGLVLFFAPIVFGWLAPYGPDSILGLEAQGFAVNLTGDLMLLSGLFVLGGDFWEKLRALFVHGASARFPAA